MREKTGLNANLGLSELGPSIGVVESSQCKATRRSACYNQVRTVSVANSGQLHKNLLVICARKSLHLRWEKEMQRLLGYHAHILSEPRAEDVK